jgi:glyceraldehyde-3-phosphate dehydrogenase/erythrose-4-phosphate dehydrogenase
LTHLTRYDSTHGRFTGDVLLAGNTLEINGHAIRLLSVPSPERLPWAELDVDVVLECTGPVSCARRRGASSAGRRKESGDWCSTV